MSEWHAKLSGSGAERWIGCSASVRLTEWATENGFIHERVEAEWMTEGKLAHIDAANCLNNGTNSADPFIQMYLDYVRGLFDETSIVKIEYTLPMWRTFHKDTGGTADFISWHPATRELAVADLKYGKWKPVYLGNNWQLRYYAVGAVVSKRGVRPRAVRLAISQPRTGQRTRLQEMIYPIEVVDKWAAQLRAAIERTESPTAQLNPDTWCTWCPCNQFCKDNNYELPEELQRPVAHPEGKAKIQTASQDAGPDGSSQIQQC